MKLTRPNGSAASCTSSPSLCARCSLTEVAASWVLGDTRGCGAAFSVQGGRGVLRVWELLLLLVALRVAKELRMLS